MLFRSPPRLLVIGDSTSLMLAKALNDAAAGALTVQWAGQEGCPLVPVDAVRSSPKVDWMTLTRCRDVATDLPKAVDAFHPDAVLLVLASDVYSEADYIRDLDEYLALCKPSLTSEECAV